MTDPGDKPADQPDEQEERVEPVDIVLEVQSVVVVMSAATGGKNGESSK